MPLQKPDSSPPPSSDTLSSAPKQRGRPRRKPQEVEEPAAKEKTENGEELSIEEDKEQEKTVDKPKRGRPPKPKSSTDTPSLFLATDEPIAKRPRGRPPKPRSPEVETPKSTEPKRSRGRPRKNQVGISTATTSASKKAQTNSPNIDDDVSMDDAENSDDKTHGPTLESGHIYFYYRPKVSASSGVTNVDDVQRLYFILQPGTSESAHPKNRLVVVTRKKLPEIHDKDRYWGFVRKATSEFKELSSLLDEENYDTKSKSSRKLQAAKSSGQGVYAIVEHNDHSHLAYVLTLPKQPGELQEAFNITKEGSFIISVKNPEKPNPAYAGLSTSQKAQFPSHLQTAFHDRRFISLDTTEYLDVDNCEILLIGASEDTVSELGPAGSDLHKTEEEGEGIVARLGEDHVIFEELRLNKEKPHVELHGEWK